MIRAPGFSRGIVMRQPALLYLLLVLGGPVTAAAQEDLSQVKMARVGMCACACNGTSMCVPSFSNECPVDCRTACPGQTDVDAQDSEFAILGQQPDPIDHAALHACLAVPQTEGYAPLVNQVESTIRQDGAAIWGPADKGGNTLLYGDALRRALVAAAPSADAIQGADTSTLEHAIGDAVADCRATFPLAAAYQYFRQAAAQDPSGSLTGAKDGNYAAVRQRFSTLEAGKQDIRDQLYCYSGEDIQQLEIQLDEDTPRQPAETSSPTGTAPAPAGTPGFQGPPAPQP
jgi:hypothetical protein